MSSRKRQTKANRATNSGGVLVIVPCGAQKIWDRKPHAGKIAAKEAYSSLFFKVNREYAQTFGTEWRILSAKYGIMHPDQLVENYDCKFDDSYLDRRNWWKLEGMVRQARALPHFERIVLLGGKLYREIMRKVFLGIYLPKQISEPFAGCNLLATIRDVQVAIATEIGVTERVYRLQQRLLKNPNHNRQRARLIEELVRLATEDGCLDRIAASPSGKPS